MVPACNSNLLKSPLGVRCNLHEHLSSLLITFHQRSRSIFSQQQFATPCSIDITSISFDQYFIFCTEFKCSMHIFFSLIRCNEHILKVGSRDQRHFIYLNSTLYEQTLEKNCLRYWYILNWTGHDNTNNNKKVSDEYIDALHIASSLSAHISFMCRFGYHAHVGPTLFNTNKTNIDKCYCPHSTITKLFRPWPKSSRELI